MSSYYCVHRDDDMEIHALEASSEIMLHLIGNNLRVVGETDSEATDKVYTEGVYTRWMKPQEMHAFAMQLLHISEVWGGIEIEGSRSWDAFEESRRELWSDAEKRRNAWDERHARA